MRPLRSISIAFWLFLFPGVLQAQTPRYENPLGDIDSIPEFLAVVLHGIFLIGTAILIVFIIYAGFLFVTAQGSEEKIRRAKSAILWAVIGSAVFLGAEIFSLLIAETVNELR